MTGFFLQLFGDMFYLGLPILEKVLRPIIVYIFLIVGLRLAGKRELAQINTFDFVVLLMLSNTVQNAIIGDDNTVTGGIIGAISLLVANYLVVRFMFRHTKLTQLLDGAPVTLIKHGKLQRRQLDHELITRNELMAAAYRQGFRSLENIEECVLETGGSLAFIPKDPNPARTHHDDIVRRLDLISAQLQALKSPSAPQE
ncbi:MAG: DUF421 domain-containing protein [Chloroflexi bacterium SZAS-1]|jgi:uncharacterized membrane protein YcaP (DUF421 family)|nr:DUF421 domain-containing protein [Chloroflexi bacterium SZAS-1]